LIEAVEFTIGPDANVSVNIYRIIAQCLWYVWWTKYRWNRFVFIGRPKKPVMLKCGSRMTCGSHYKFRLYGDCYPDSGTDWYFKPALAHWADRQWRN